MEKFKDLTYTRPDPAKLKKDYLALVRKFEKAETAEEADAALPSLKGN